jgi:hypothetical protein
MPIFPFLTNMPAWWLRFILLLMLGLPLLTGWPINLLATQLLPFLARVDTNFDEVQLIAFICSWALYSAFIWIVVLLNVGTFKFLEYMSIAVVVAITTALLGALVRKVLPMLDGSKGPGVIDTRMVWVYLMIMTSVPFSLMAINMFSSKKILDAARSRMAKKGTTPTLYLHLCLALRMLQHVGEVVVRLFDVWREEHPEILIPRNRREWKGKWYSSANFFPWAVDAVSSWAFALMMMTFAPLPSFVHEIKSIQVKD